MRVKRQAESYISSSGGDDVVYKIRALAEEASKRKTTDDGNKWICKHCNDKNAQSALSCLSCGKYK